MNNDFLKRLRDDTYNCDRCGGVFSKAWTDVEALNEKEELFGDYPLEKCALVCDDCFKAAMVNCTN